MIQLEEFQCIMPIANIRSILTHGIVSNEAAKRLPHRSVALQDVQDKRDRVHIPQGLALHQYANLYFHARNPMMSRRRAEAPNLCVLRVSTDVLNIPGVVITDQNASSNYVRFYAPSQLRLLNLEYIFALNWKHPDNQIEEWKHSSAKCAEVLVPHSVPPNYLSGAYVPNQSVADKLRLAGFPHSVSIDSSLFFA